MLCEALAEPHRGPIEEVIAYRVTSVKYVAQVVLAEVDPRQRELHTGNDIQTALRGIGYGGEPIDCADVERKIGPANAGELGSEHQKIRAMDERRQAPREEQRKTEILRRGFCRIRKRIHLVFKGEHHSWIDLERQVQIERTAAGVLRV